MSAQESVEPPVAKRPRGRSKKQVTAPQTTVPTVPPTLKVPPLPPRQKVAFQKSAIVTGKMPKDFDCKNEEDAKDAIPFTPPTVTATIPTPPNWLENCENTIISLQNFKKFPIGRSSPEYNTITNLLHPIEITGIEQVVNPELWKRFVHARKEMLRSKTDDMNILSKLDMDENELLRCAHLALNFTKDPMLLPYSDNMVLLFHCTRSKSTIENILSQGLDERLSRVNGNLGRGIYFADNPMKSLQYDGSGHILIFAVLLGDCISVDNLSNKQNLVREPEKNVRQKRNCNDQFFDSIVARPLGENEYVIYNRYQCCPLYQVAYKRLTLNNGFNPATNKLPPIAWISQGASSCAMPIPVEKASHWPFFAVDLFKKMGAPAATDENTGMSVNDKLATLIDYGFVDENMNKEILSKYNNNLGEAVDYFLSLDNIAVEPPPPLVTNSNEGVIDLTDAD